MVWSRPNLHKMVTKSACIQGVLKVKSISKVTLIRALFGRPYFVRSSLCHSMFSVVVVVCDVCIVAKRYILAKNCLKEQKPYVMFVVRRRYVTWRWQCIDSKQTLVTWMGTETVIYNECIASARWSCLAGVGLIRPDLRDDGIHVLMLCAFGRSAPSAGCVQGGSARNLYRASQTCTVCM